MSKNKESTEVVHLNMKHSLQMIDEACYNPIIAKNYQLKKGYSYNNKHVH